MPDRRVTVSTNLSELVGSRICHDLISPLGAIGNGVELLGMRAAAAGPELALIADSVAAASARIRYYRIAFGAAGEGQRIGRPEILSILSSLTQGGRLRIEWDLAGDQLRSEVRLAFLLILCLESALPFGGTITLKQTRDGWQMAGHAERVKVEPSHWALLSGDAVPGPEIGAALVQFLLAPAAAKDCGRQLRCQTAETGVVVRL